MRRVLVVGGKYYGGTLEGAHRLIPTVQEVTHLSLSTAGVYLGINPVF